MDGKFVLQIGKQGQGNDSNSTERLGSPADVAVGEVRIVDRSSKETLGRFGRPGRQVGMFTALHNIAVDRQGNIFTSEVNTGQRVQKFRRMDMQN
jgi:hypothetical protein